MSQTTSNTSNGDDPIKRGLLDHEAHKSLDHAALNALNENGCEQAQPYPKPLGRPKDDTLVQRRRLEILPCAISHFASVGYHAADMDQLATTLGCAKGTIYRYFASKQELFEAAVDHVMQQLLESNPAQPTDDLVADMAYSLTKTLGFFDQHPHYVELLLQERTAFKDRNKPSFFEYCDADFHNWAARLKQGVIDGIIRDIPINTIRHIGVTLIYGSIFTNYFARHNESFETQAQNIHQIFFHGILTSHASACYHKKINTKHLQNKQQKLTQMTHETTPHVIPAQTGIHLPRVPHAVPQGGVCR